MGTLTMNIVQKPLPCPAKLIVHGCEQKKGESLCLSAKGVEGKMAKGSPKMTFKQ